MDERKIILNAIACLEYLSKGIDPITKQPVSENDIVRKSAVSKYLSYSAEKLKSMLDNAGNRENAAAPERIVCDDTGEVLCIGEIREKLNRSADPKSVGYIDTGTLLGWLEYGGFLEKHVDGKHYIITESGMDAGIFPQESPSGGLVFCYTPDAQQMIYDHETDIREYYEQYGDKREPFFISPERKSLLRAGGDTAKITDIANYLNSFADLENYKPIKAMNINRWLLSKNMIFRNDEQRKYFATDIGTDNGFSNIRIKDNRYGRLCYTSAAWQYIIDRIDELIEYNREL
ncbi:MAG: hypothetical protein IJ666_01765 [Ruminococcus sp.]|nr:hypothetical protein [Ruminococcus sp.]